MCGLSWNKTTKHAEIINNAQDLSRAIVDLQWNIYSRTVPFITKHMKKVLWVQGEMTTYWVGQVYFECLFRTVYLHNLSRFRVPYWIFGSDIWNSTSLPEQQFAGRLVTPLKHILILSQSVFVHTPWCVLSGKATNTYFMV